MPDAPPTTPPTDTTATPPEDDGKGGKAAVLADLATERDKRQALETQVQQLTAAQQAQKDAFAKALGLKPEETSDVTALAGQVTELQKQFQETQHQNTVLLVANAHGITDKDDLALLQSVKDEATMRTLAGRIAKAADPSTPKPDLTQGPQGGSGAPTGTPEQDFANFLQPKLGH